MFRRCLVLCRLQCAREYARKHKRPHNNCNYRMRIDLMLLPSLAKFDARYCCVWGRQSTFNKLCLRTILCYSYTPYLVIIQSEEHEHLLLKHFETGKHRPIFRIDIEQHRMQHPAKPQCANNKHETCWSRLFSRCCLFCLEFCCFEIERFYWVEVRYQFK